VVAAGDSERSYAQRLGIDHDRIVQELGWDDDTDDEIRADVEEACGSDLLGQGESFSAVSRAFSPAVQQTLC
jgi:hypothetical protein